MSCYVQSCKSRKFTKKKPPEKDLNDDASDAKNVDPPKENPSCLEKVGGGDNGGDREEENLKKNKLHFFILSKCATPDVREAWLKSIPEILGRPFKGGHRGHLICSRHFDPEDIEYGEKFFIQGEWTTIPRAYPILRKGAVPTRHLGDGVNPVKVEKNLKRKTPTVPVPAAVPKPKDEGKDNEFAFENPTLRKDYFCAFCLKSWISRIVSNRVTMTKVKTLERFLRHFGKYAGIFLDLKMDKLFDRNAAVGTERKTIFHCEALSVCTNCEEKMEEISGVLEKLEVMMMEVNRKMVDFKEEIWRCSKQEILGRERQFGRVVGVEGLERVKGYRRAFRSAVADDRILTPKVTLTRMKNKDLLRYQDERESNEETEGTLVPTAISIGRKHGRKELVPPPPAPASTMIFSGGSEVRKFLGRGSSSGILTCTCCGKAFYSKEELEDHQDTYHDVNTIGIVKTVRIQKETPMEVDLASDNQDGGQGGDNSDTDASNDDGDAGMENGSDFLDDCQSLGTRDIANMKTLSSSSKPSTPRLVLNENLLETKETSSTINLTNILKPGAMPELTLRDIFTQDTIESNNDAVPSPSTSIIPKPEENEDELPPKKVPFMSAEYIGKYKIVCKLKNLQTGKTCVGIVAKPSSTTTTGTGAPSGPSSSTISMETFTPKVISTQPEPKPKPKRIRTNQNRTGKVYAKVKKLPKDYLEYPGPPYRCPLPDCTLTYLSRTSCKRHHRRHKAKLQKSEEIKARKLQMKSAKQKEFEQKLLQGGPLTAKEKLKQIRIIQGKTPEKIIKLNRNVVYCNEPDCYRASTKPDFIEIHKKYAHSDIKCKFCSELLPDLQRLIDHELQQHSDTPNEDSSEITCPRCHDNMKNLQRKHIKTIFDHYEHIHLKPTRRVKLLNCSECSRTFFSEEKYMNHQQNFHGITIPRPFSCDLCDRQFTTEIRMKFHKRSNHPETQKAPRSRARRREVLTCNLCSAVYTIRHHFNQHMKLHSQNIIDQSGKRIWRRDRSEYPFPCDLCDRRFPSDAHLWNHKMKDHHGGVKGGVKKSIRGGGGGGTCQRQRKGLRSFICDSCGKSFYNNGYLQRHLLKEHPEPGQEDAASEQGVVCELCGKRVFSEAFLQNVHMKRVHPLGEDGILIINDPDRHECQFCGKVFKKRGYMTDHVKRVHKKKDKPK